MSHMNLAIVGIGNCASALIQGIHYYKLAGADDAEGLMLRGFEANILEHFPNPESIRWTDENALIVFKKTG